MANDGVAVSVSFEKRKFLLLENALDSLEVGIHVYLEGTPFTESSHKHAILNIFHCVELLLKERLRLESFTYLEANPKLITEKSKTVGFSEIVHRFKKLD